MRRFAVVPPGDRNQTGHDRQVVEIVRVISIVSDVVQVSNIIYYMATFEGYFRLFLGLLNSLSAFDVGSSV